MKKIIYIFLLLIPLSTFAINQKEANVISKIIECKTIRLNNLVPYSSRNLHLSKNEIGKASFVSKCIYKLYLSIKKNFNNRLNISLVKSNIESKKIISDYLEIRNKTNLSKNFNKKNFKIFIAYYLNDIRLIDNF